MQTCYIRLSTSKVDNCSLYYSRAKSKIVYHVLAIHSFTRNRNETFETRSLRLRVLRRERNLLSIFLVILFSKLAIVL